MLGTVYVLNSLGLANKKICLCWLFYLANESNSSLYLSWLLNKLSLNIIIYLCEVWTNSPYDAWFEYLICIFYIYIYKNIFI